MEIIKNHKNTDYKIIYRPISNETPDRSSIWSVVASRVEDNRKIFECTIEGNILDYIQRTYGTPREEFLDQLASSEIERLADA